MSKIAYNTPVALELENQIQFLKPIWEEIVAEVDGMRDDGGDEEVPPEEEGEEEVEEGDEKELIDAMRQFCSPKWALEKHQEWLKETATFERKVREGLLWTDEQYLWSEYAKVNDDHIDLVRAAWSLYKRFVLYIVS